VDLQVIQDDVITMADNKVKAVPFDVSWVTNMLFQIQAVYDVLQFFSAGTLVFSK